MQLLNYEQVLAMPKVVCLDIREQRAYDFSPTSGGLHIPYTKIQEKEAELRPFIGLPVVIFSSNYPQRCNRAKIAENALQKIGFTKIYGIENGLMAGWTMPTNKKELPHVPTTV
jgi:rhodanese-related sulfurtransferase